MPSIGVQAARSRLPWIMRTLLVGAAACVAALALTTSGAVADRLITGRDIKDGSVGIRDLRPAVQKRITTTPATAPEKIGRLVSHDHFQAPIAVHWTGGAFDAQHAQPVAHLTFKPGTYLVTLDALFSRYDSDGDSSTVPPPSSPILEVHFVGGEGSQEGSPFGRQQFFGAATGAFPAGDQTVQSASTTRVVIVTEFSSAWVYLWGTNADGSTTGSGDYRSDVDVSVIRVDG